MNILQKNQAPRFLIQGFFYTVLGLYLTVFFRRLVTGRPHIAEPPIICNLGIAEGTA